MAVLILLLLILIPLSPALAEDIPVDIKAEKLKYIEGGNIIEASGSVEVKLKEVTIWADFLRMDSASNVVTAEGNVKMTGRSYQALADYIVYDASREVSSFSRFKSRFAASKTRGSIFLSADELTDSGDKRAGTEGRLTTCENRIPHFFLIADKVVYYPEDKVVGYNVTLYVGRVPVLWMPYLYYNLRRKQNKNWVFGHNDVEGDFLKSAWGYPGGILYLDLMQRKGFGYGTESYYDLLGLGAGALYLYHLNENDTGTEDWVSRINHSRQINPWTNLKLDHRYTSIYLIPSGRMEQTSFGLDLSYKKEARWNLRLGNFEDRLGFLQRQSLHFDQAYQNISTTYDFNYDYLKRDPKWIRASQRLYHRRPFFSDKTIFTTRMNYYNNVAGEGEPGDERLEPEIEIAGRENLFSWAYRSNWYIDVDRDTYAADANHQYLEKIPEIDINPRSLDLRLFSLQPTFGYGYYHEVRYVSELGRNRDFAAQRFRSTLNASKNIPLALGTAAVLTAGLDQFLYGPGDQLYAYRESLGLNTNLFGFFRNNINAKRGITEGNTPFLFDQLGTRYHNFDERMTFYYKNIFGWTTTTGYNWQTNKWFDAMTALTIRPNNQFYWNLRTGWDIENIRYRDLVNTLNYSPYSFLSMHFSTVSDMNEGRVKSGSAVYDIYFLQGQPNQWRLKFSQIFDPLTDEFKVRDIMIVKELHCWDLTYTYSDYRKEFSLVFSLKALPDMPAGLSTGRGFYVEGFEAQFKELTEDIKPEKAIRRY